MDVTRHQLPDGGWFDLRRTSTITERERRRIRRAHASFLAAPGTGRLTTPEEVDAWAGLIAEACDVLIPAASFTADGTITLDTLDEMTGAVYDELQTIISPALKAALEGVDFTPAIDDTTGQVDAESPSVPSPS